MPVATFSDTLENALVGILRPPRQALSQLRNQWMESEYKANMLRLVGTLTSDEITLAWEQGCPRELPLASGSSWAGISTPSSASTSAG